MFSTRCSWHSNTFPVQPRANRLRARACSCDSPETCKPTRPAIIQTVLLTPKSREKTPRPKGKKYCSVLKSNFKRRGGRANEARTRNKHSNQQVGVSYFQINGVSYFLLRWLHFQHQLWLPLINPDCTESWFASCQYQQKFRENQRCPLNSFPSLHWFVDHPGLQRANPRSWTRSENKMKMSGCKNWMFPRVWVLVCLFVCFCIINW